MFKTILRSFINPQYELCLLAKEVDSDYLEKEFVPLYRDVERPSIPIRTLLWLLLQKLIHNLSGEMVMERYIDIPNCQQFCSEYTYNINIRLIQVLLYIFTSELEKKVYEDLNYSIVIFCKENSSKEVKWVRVNTTVQEKNLTFPTDPNLIEKVIEHLRELRKRKE